MCMYAIRRVIVQRGIIILITFSPKKPECSKLAQIFAQIFAADFVC